MMSGAHCGGMDQDSLALPMAKGCQSFAAEHPVWLSHEILVRSRLTRTLS